MLAPVLSVALDAATRRGARPLLMAATGVASVALGCVALGFATKAGFDVASASIGAVDAALLVAAIYVGTAAAIWPLAFLTCRIVERRARRVESRRDETETLLRLLEGGDRQSVALAEVLKAGRELSPFPMIALALAGGFVAGRTASKQPITN